jgi:hypothetical protein
MRRASPVKGVCICPRFMFNTTQRAVQYTQECTIIKITVITTSTTATATATANTTTTAVTLSKIYVYESGNRN